ncbi:hypothetical protein BH09MYX1_BH09MYX1_46360 [soil metagenome]
MRTMGFLLLATAMGSMAIGACSDPVPDGQIKALGDEVDGVPQGEYHRAGQPCVSCHTTYGPASAHPFAVAGTVFAVPGGATGVEDAYVGLTDTTGSSFVVKTNCVGNFFITKAEWDPAFPIFVRAYKGNAARTMQGQIGRERACANCHKDPRGVVTKLSSVGHIYLYGAGDNVPPPQNCPVNPTVGGN